MKILIVTDAWFPQVNGVVTTLSNVGSALERRGHAVKYLTHQDFRTFPLPTYKEIRLAWDVWNVGPKIREFDPDAIHIATEGTLGIAARIYCGRHNIPFTTSYHTKTPEYIKARAKFVPLSWGYAFMRWLHKPSSTILVTTQSVKEELTEWGFDESKLVVWSRGVDHEVFNPSRRKENFFGQDGQTVLLYAGRVSVEKNLEAFLSEHTPNAIKVVVGDGPDRKILEEKFPNAIFLGYKMGVELAECMASADVFVFPSRSDTFGIVMIESAACGTPIAAYPVTGPKDFVVNNVTGYMSENIQQAMAVSQFVDRAGCHAFTKANYSWETCADIIEQALLRI